MGWDIDNENGYAESYREVIHEDKLKVGGATKAPDYSFRLVGGKRLFFVEAKKPSIQVKDEIPPAYQVRRYGWSAKMPISIITDFEEFSLYDCTKKPQPTDKASVARITYLTFQDYLKEFDFIWETFSKEHVLKGSFDKFIQSDTHKKGTVTVDKEFLQSLDVWRTYLATSISWNNKGLDEDEINFAVQQTIDRIIFLRIAEDRSVEPYGNLKNALKQGEYYQNLFSIFKEADDKYNSGLFDFKKDKICQALKIDNKVIKTIINELYYPECPYEFSVLSVEILGSAYEQFLGKVIRITPAHHAKIEEKPEVRKAGGVYYTPQYIVDYIVKNTVGKLTEGKTPKEISSLKIVDPACGSGSFLIGAYQYLLDWHKSYYTDNGKVSKGNKGNPLTPDGNLTTAEKKRILLNNIYGVDIDLNAVEVTKLSLLLKCLEGETEASIATQLRLFNERVLPTLDDNIKSGNSLIDTDFYSGEFELGFEKKIKPFNWQKAFPEVFKKKQELYSHVVFAIKNSRYDYERIQFKREVGFIAHTYPFLEGAEEEILVEELCKTAIELGLDIIGLNFCGDHVHAIISRNTDELTNTMRLWKGKTSYGYNRRVNPSVDNQPAIKSDGTKQELWAKSYYEKYIESEEQLRNVVTYIKNNRINHDLPPLPEKSQALIGRLIGNLGNGDNQQALINRRDDFNNRNNFNRRVNPSVKLDPSVKQGGFDVVIGNPPYVMLQNLETREVFDYSLKKYYSAKYKIDTYQLFTEQSINLLKDKGLLGFITPNTFLKNIHAEPLRKFILENTILSEILLFNYSVFAAASVDTCIFILEKGKATNKSELGVYISDVAFEVQKLSRIDQSVFASNNRTDFTLLISDYDLEVLNKILKNTKPLSYYCGAYFGIQTFDRNKYVSQEKNNNHFEPVIDGGNIGPYKLKPSREFVNYIPSAIKSGGSELIYRQDRICIRQIGASPIATFVPANIFTLNTIYNVYLKEKNLASLKFLLGLINSKATRFFWKKNNSDEKKTFPKIKKEAILSIPIPTITKDNSGLHDEIVKLVDQLLQLNEEIQNVSLDSRRQQIQGKIEYCETRINEIVYQLYGLTEEEIKIVEGK